MVDKACIGEINSTCKCYDREYISERTSVVVDICGLSICVLLGLVYLKWFALQETQVVRDFY